MSPRCKSVELTPCVNWLSKFVAGVAAPPTIESISFGAYIVFVVFFGLAEGCSTLARDVVDDSRKRRMRSLVFLVISRERRS